MLALATDMPAEFQLDWIQLSADQIKLRCREAGLPAASTRWENQAQYLTFLLEKVLRIIQPAADFEAAKHTKGAASEAHTCLQDVGREGAPLLPLCLRPGQALSARVSMVTTDPYLHVLLCRPTPVPCL